MEVIEAIFTRRSVREFEEIPLTQNQVTTLLKAAMQAPSAHNRQPWHFIVIDDRQILNQIADFHPYAKMLYQAPLAITVCGDLQLEDNDRYLALNCAAATQNILLAAHGMGLGAVWIGIYPREQRIRTIKSLLNLPLHIVPISMVAVGHKAREPQPKNRFKVQKVHKNQWNVDLF